MSAMLLTALLSTDLAGISRAPLLFSSLSDLDLDLSVTDAILLFTPCNRLELGHGPFFFFRDKI
jgi:hypothetical protein